MEPQPRARAVLAVAVLLLYTLGSASPHCGDCDSQSGPLTKRCPAGHFLKRSCTPPCGTPPTCSPCQDGTFMAHENHSFVRCLRCRSCDEGLLLATLRNCSAEANTHCGCQPGWYLQCWDIHCRDSEHIKCRPCADCRARNRRPPAACEDPLAAIPPGLPRSSVPTHHLSPAGSGGSQDCGACLDDFYEHRNNCVPCPMISLGSCPEPCSAQCGWRRMFGIQLLVAVLVVPLLLGATLIYMYHRCHTANPVVSEEAPTGTLTPLQDSASAHTLLALPGGSKGCAAQVAANSWMSRPLQTQEVPSSAVPWIKNRLPSPALGPPSTPPAASPAGWEAAVLQPGPQLYDVIDAVPARRWKEFVRTLGLREAEIEAVEVEVDRFRDQQYEMLKRWRQQESAGLGAVYRALERMGLDGCAEDLRGRLQHGA